MGFQSNPQWLLSAFARAVEAVGSSASEQVIEQAGEEVLQRWTSPGRHFHNKRHLIDTLARVEELAGETHHPDVVRLAVWYHGAVFSTEALRAYARNAGEDKEAGAELAETDLARLGVPAEVRSRIAFLILNLKRHHADPGDIDAQVVSDAELSIVAANPQRYREYRMAVREEFSHLPVRHYLEGRVQVVRALLARRTIFQSPLAQAWEDQAQENLTAELARLEGELARLGECSPGDHLPTVPGQDAPDPAPATKRGRDRRPRPHLDDPDHATGTQTLRRVPRTEALPVPAPPPPRPRPEAATTEGAAQVEHGIETQAERRSGGARLLGRGTRGSDTRSSLETGPESLFAAMEHDEQPDQQTPRPAEEDAAEPLTTGEDPESPASYTPSAMERDPDMSTRHRRSR